MITIDIKMPENCWYCPIEHDSNCGVTGKYIYSYKTQRSPICPLTDVKELKGENMKPKFEIGDVVLASKVGRFIEGVVHKISYFGDAEGDKAIFYDLTVTDSNNKDDIGADCTLWEKDLQLKGDLK